MHPLELRRGSVSCRPSKSIPHTSAHIPQGPPMSNLPPRITTYLIPIARLLVRLPARAPNTLQEPIPLRQPVHAVVALAHGAHKAAQRIRLVLARVAAVLVHLADADLHRGVVLGLDDAVRGAALARDVAVWVVC